MDTTRLDAAIAAANEAVPADAFAEPAAKDAERAWPDGLPQPGIYPDVPYEDYRDWPAVNASALKILAAVTPKHAKAYMDGEVDKDTPDRKKGRAFHCALLEPKDFAKRFPVGDACQETIASGSRKGEPCGKPGVFYDRESDAWYCGTHAKAHPTSAEVEELLTKTQHSSIEKMKKSVYDHKVVQMVRQHGGCEVSLIWDQDGFPCKGRLDKLIIDQSCPTTIIDLKKIQPMRGTESCLQKAARDCGYDLSAWWYRNGLMRVRTDIKRPLFAWIFTEDGPPHDVNPKWASKPMLEIGRIKATKAFEAYKWCMQSGVWPGYCDDIDELYPADWEMKRYGINQ